MDDEDAKNEILAAAYGLLCQMPYQKLTMEMVARRAGVSKALLFYHFGSKHELTREALKVGFAEAMERFDVFEELSEEDVRAVLPELFKFSLDSMFLFISFIEVVDMEAHADDELALLMRDMYNRIIVQLGDFLEARGENFPREKAMLLALAVDMFGMVPHVTGAMPDIQRYTAAVLDIMGLEVRP